MSNFKGKNKILFSDAVEYLCKKADGNSASILKNEIDLIDACEKGILSRAVEILEQYPDALSLKDSDGLFLLIIAAGNDQSEMIRYLVHKGVDIDQAVSSNGWTALMNAACFGHIRSTVELLSLSANPQIRSIDGRTAMDIAEANGHKQVCLVLQKYFAILTSRR